MREMAGWLAAGKLKTREDIVAGLETFPDTLLKLFRGENFGKLVLKDRKCSVRQKSLDLALARQSLRSCRRR